MSEAKSGDTVRVHYTGRLDDGTQFDTSSGGDPMEITLGQRSVIPGFESALVGMAAGASKTITIPVDEAYGAHQAEGVQEIERSNISDEVDLTVGARLQATGPDGQTVLLTVIALTDDTVTLDANHPLAGENLTFDIELVEIV